MLSNRPFGTYDQFWNFMQAQAAQSQNQWNAANAYNQAANMAAAQQLHGMQNAYQNVHPILPHEPAKERTPEEIQAQLEARMAELEAEAERIALRDQTACNRCRWADDFDAAWCHHPMVKGFGAQFHMGMDRSGIDQKTIPKLCGPEKALWDQSPTRWQRFVAWLISLTASD